MKRIFGILALLTVVALAATATGYASEATLGNPPPVLVQTVEADVPFFPNADPSDWNIGIAVAYSNQGGLSNVGLQAVAEKSLNVLLGWRLSVSVNGFVPQAGFDRYGTALTGPVLNLGPVYAFVQLGAAYNPSNQHVVSVAANTGAGVAFDIGRHSRIFAEASIDAVPTGGRLKPTVGAGIGYAVRL